MIEKQRKGKPPKLLKKDDVVFKFHEKKIVVSIILLDPTHPPFLLVDFDVLKIYIIPCS